VLLETAKDFMKSDDLNATLLATAGDVVTKLAKMKKNGPRLDSREPSVVVPESREFMVGGSMVDTVVPVGNNGYGFSVQDRT
jgi:hypothetical protein